ncbi:Protein of unknown function, DUF488 [Paenibacillus sp. UNCCL117]|uniref:DUF488 domain-containing protein n=1 Tax=unclassified Paenibacillus TaxID=185978 RepID=UPI00088AD6F4|nr:MULTISPECIES: DUF488 domain-containing protein [unclassified Paenibacillus]SDD18295.1 Protein of unknown function, DUF488 [Paenibacillus sp. cl123]SFW35192.1 Protein of unknown function, DUF488 [Paenibacillus sp. UNCCL117]
MQIFTIGHSTHSKENFIEMLGFAQIKFVADVRAFPASRKYPQFGKGEMEKWLSEENISYQHFPALGGRRGISPSVGASLNEGWNNPSFHNYADYTLTEDFAGGMDELVNKAASMKLAYMCSERHPARCHRLLISNWLTANGWEVYHMIDNSRGETELVQHQLGKWGAMPIIEEDGTIVYPKIG